MNKVIIITLVFVCFACKNESQPATLEIDKPVEKVIEYKLRNFKEEDVARFAISAIMGQDSKTIQVRKDEDRYILSYNRKSDRQKFSYKVKIVGRQILWSSLAGQYKDHDLDGRIEFTELENKIEIIQTFSDGSQSRDEFAKGR